MTTVNLLKQILLIYSLELYFKFHTWSNSSGKSGVIAERQILVVDPPKPLVSQETAD